MKELLCEGVKYIVPKTFTIASKRIQSLLRQYDREKKAAWEVARELVGSSPSGKEYV